MTGGASLGLVGLGVMGSNLAQNFRDKGVSVSGYEHDPDILVEFQRTTPDIPAAGDMAAFVASLNTPRTIFLMVKAGPVVDDVINSLLDHLSLGDCILDGGNSYWKDSSRRAEMLSGHGISFGGIGVSGGAKGARNGPSIMIGCENDVYPRFGPMLQSIAAKSPDGETCAGRVGPPPAGHFVKMVHNGIEYADMQIISEAYWLLRQNLGLTPAQIADIFEDWAGGELSSFLLEVSVQVLRAEDSPSGGPLIEQIRDRAAQKGTGQWTSEAALDLGIPAPTLVEAVMARTLSSMSEERDHAATVWPEHNSGGNIVEVDDVRAALLAARLAAYGQGFALLQAAGVAYSWSLDLPAIARLWRGGCIIRAKCLDWFADAAQGAVNPHGLLLAPELAERIAEDLPRLRSVAGGAISCGYPVPCMASAASYLDGLSTTPSAASLIQGQRDNFGQHGFEWRDGRSAPGHFNWDNPK